MYLHECVNGIHHGFEHLVPHEELTQKPAKHVAYSY
jgi:hypothetical protein